MHKLSAYDDLILYQSVTKNSTLEPTQFRQGKCTTNTIKQVNTCRNMSQPFYCSCTIYKGMLVKSLQILQHRIEQNKSQRHKYNLQNWDTWHPPCAEGISKPLTGLTAQNCYPKAANYSWLVSVSVIPKYLLQSHFFSHRLINKSFQPVFDWSHS